MRGYYRSYNLKLCFKKLFKLLILIRFWRLQTYYNSEIHLQINILYFNFLFIVCSRFVLLTFTILRTKFFNSFHTLS